jgi:hypothetical protein
MEMQEDRGEVMDGFIIDVMTHPPIRAIIYLFLINERVPIPFATF